MWLHVATKRKKKQKQQTQNNKQNFVVWNAESVTLLQILNFKKGT